MRPIIRGWISLGPAKPAEPGSGRQPCLEGTFLGNKLIKASLGGWGKRHRGEYPGSAGRDSCQLTMGRAVSAEHRGTDPPGARERVWLGGRCPHEVGGVASWREAFRSELLRADSDFPKEQFQMLTLSSRRGQVGGSEGALDH